MQPAFGGSFAKGGGMAVPPLGGLGGLPMPSLGGGMGGLGGPMLGGLGAPGVGGLNMLGLGGLPSIGGLPGGLPRPAGLSKGMGAPPNLGVLGAGALGMGSISAKRPPSLAPTMVPPFTGGPPGPALFALRPQGLQGGLQGLTAQTSKAGSVPLPAGTLIPSAAKEAEPPVPCTAYIGRIPGDVSDDFVRTLLEKCGKVTKWNRASDPNTGKLTSFGFCDFEDPQGLFHALQFLHEKQLCDKRLLVKCEDRVKVNIDSWKAKRKDEIWENGISIKDDEAKEGGEKKKGPKAGVMLNDHELDEALLQESQALAEDLDKLLVEKCKGYPEIKADSIIIESKEETEKKASENDKTADKEKVDGENKENKDTEGKTDENAQKHAESNGTREVDPKEVERLEEKKKRDAEREAQREKDREREKRLEKALSRHYRVSRRERDRADRVRDREDDIHKEYQYRLRTFERDEEGRIKAFKRKLRDSEPVEELSDRDKRRFVEKDLSYGRRGDEDEWNRQRQNRESERKKEAEKDAVDRAEEQAAAQEENKKRQEEERNRQKEEEEARETARREMEEEQRRQREEDRKKREEEQRREDDEKERVRLEEEKVKQAAQKEKQDAAAAKLLAQVTEEMKTATIQKIPTKDDGKGVDGPEPRVREEPKLKEEDMRKLIQQVPTDKARAFQFQIDWGIVHDHNILEKKLRPWVKKKVTEYLGAEEGGMIEFIMRKVAAHAPPSSILAELEGFLDEEAENFTLKMWRMLIFEVLRVKAR